MWYLPEFEILAEVNFSDNFVVGKFKGSSRLQNTAFKQKVWPVGYWEGFMHIMISDQHPDIFFFQFYKK